MTTQSELLSKAPEGATHYKLCAKDSIKDIEFYKKDGERWKFLSSKNKWELVSIFFDELNITPLPQPIKENWFEEGKLPPVGAECEWSSNGVSFEPCTILIYHANTVVLYHTKYPKNVRLLKAEELIFRTLKSDREKCIEDAFIALGWKPDTNNGHYSNFGNLYDAGLLRTREDK